MFGGEIGEDDDGKGWEGGERSTCALRYRSVRIDIDCVCVCVCTRALALLSTYCHLYRSLLVCSCFNCNLFLILFLRSFFNNISHSALTARYAIISIKL